MLDSVTAQLALRARAVSVTVATTGTLATLSATATGYARSSGSFLTDGFAPGMEITLVTGFSTSGNNQATTAQGRVITSVTALAITCTGCAVEAAGGSRIITAGLPFDRAWENKAFEPTSGRPYIEEDFVPGVTALMGQRDGGLVVEQGLYVLKLYGIADTGISAIHKTIDALRALFAIGTSLTSGSTTVRIGDVDGGTRQRGPVAGQIISAGLGRSVRVLTVPWYSFSTNTIAA
jgi:hypothetical protein